MKRGHALSEEKTMNLVLGGEGVQRNYDHDKHMRQNKHEQRRKVKDLMSAYYNDLKRNENMDQNYVDTTQTDLST